MQAQRQKKSTQNKDCLHRQGEILVKLINVFGEIKEYILFMKKH